MVFNFLAILSFESSKIPIKFVKIKNVIIIYILPMQGSKNDVDFSAGYSGIQKKLSFIFSLHLFILYYSNYWIKALNEDERDHIFITCKKILKARPYLKLA